MLESSSHGLATRDHQLQSSAHTEVSVQQAHPSRMRISVQMALMQLQHPSRPLAAAHPAQLATHVLMVLVSMATPCSHVHPATFVLFQAHLSSKHHALLVLSPRGMATKHQVTVNRVLQATTASQQRLIHC
jgi:hypothetical protein